MIKVSIIIINHNYEKYLDRCINSALKQNTNIKYEIIIVDDGSTDGSKKILKKFLNTRKIKIFFLKNKGIEFASNFGIRKANGKYVVRLDSDDYIKKNYLDNSYKKINKSDYAFVYSNYEIKDEKNKTIITKILPKFNMSEIISRGDFLATGTLFNKKIIKKYEYYNTKIKNCGLENYELILKLLLGGHCGYKIDQVLFCYTRHNKNFSKKNFLKIKKYGSNLFKKFNLGIYKTNKNHPYL